MATQTQRPSTFHCIATGPTVAAETADGPTSPTNRTGSQLPLRAFLHQPNALNEASTAAIAAAIQ